MKLDKFNNDRPKIFILVGVPASGKSTWTNEKVSNSPYSFDVISSDNIIESIAKEHGSNYSKVYVQYAGFATKQVWEDFKESISKRNNIIWDQTNMTAKKRRKILSQLPKDYETTAVVFEVDSDEVNRRLNARAEKEGKFIPKHVIESMVKSYERPVDSEGFDNIEFIK